jgi:hypothetical protein
MSLPQRGQVSGSHSKTLRISRAQLARLFDFGSPAGPDPGEAATVHAAVEERRHGVLDHRPERAVRKLERSSWTRKNSAKCAGREPVPYPLQFLRGYLHPALEHHGPCTRAGEQVPVADALARFAHDLAVAGWDTAVIA